MLHSPLCECCSVTPWAVVNRHQIPKKWLQKKNQDYPQEKLSHVSRRLHWTGTSNGTNGSPWCYKTVIIIFLPKKVASWRGNSHIPYQKHFWSWCSSSQGGFLWDMLVFEGVSSPDFQFCGLDSSFFHRSHQLRGESILFSKNFLTAETVEDVDIDLKTHLSRGGPCCWR